MSSIFRLFTKMPSNHYVDETQLLLSAASDDIHEADKIRTAVKVREIIIIYIFLILILIIFRICGT